MAYIRKNVVGDDIYVYVVKNERENGKPVQKFICSLGEINQVLQRLKKWIK